MITMEKDDTPLVIGKFRQDTADTLRLIKICVNAAVEFGKTDPLKVRSGKTFPLGIAVIDMARELSIPVAIVTSTYHHADEFEAVRDLVTTPYVDTLVDGKKDWDRGIAYLLRCAKQ